MLLLTPGAETDPPRPFQPASTNNMHRKCTNTPTCSEGDPRTTRFGQRCRTLWNEWFRLQAPEPKNVLTIHTECVPAVHLGVDTVRNKWFRVQHREHTHFVPMHAGTTPAINCRHADDQRIRMLQCAKTDRRVRRLISRGCSKMHV